MNNTSLLDYRMPTALDLPMIEAVIVEVPNPGHPFGIRGVGEAGIVPPLAAMANAVYRATGVRMTDLPDESPRHRGIPGPERGMSGCLSIQRGAEIDLVSLVLSQLEYDEQADADLPPLPSWERARVRVNRNIKTMLTWH